MKSWKRIGVIALAALLTVLVALGVWAWNTPPMHTYYSFIKKYGWETRCNIDVPSYAACMQESDEVGNHLLELGTVGLREPDGTVKPVYCIVNDAGDVLFDNYVAQQLVVNTIPDSPYLLMAALSPEYAIAVSGVPESAEEYLAMVHEDVADYGDPRNLCDYLIHSHDETIVLDASIPDAEYEAYKQQVMKLALVRVTLVRAPAAKFWEYWETMEEFAGDKICESPLVYSYLPPHPDSFVEGYQQESLTLFTYDHFGE